MYLTFLYWFLMIFFCPIVHAAVMQGVHIKEKSGKTDILININGKHHWKSFMLDNPERLVVDLQQVDSNPHRFPLQKTQLVSKVRTGHPKPGTLRLVFDLQRPVRTEVVPGGNGIHLILTPKTSLAVKSPPKPVSKTMDVQPVIPPKKPIVVKGNPSRQLRDIVVVIDAGHGGKDPGAKGPRRTQEKDVVLSIAVKLKQLIDRQPGMRAVMTRKGDYYIGLRERLKIARRYNGDIFVSIHADAFIHQHSHGASVFALSQSGATSEAARWLAEKENYSELGGVNLADLDDRNGIVRSVLIDLSQTATINAGLRLGTRVLRQMGNMTSLHNHRVEQARFMVLKSPDTPSILVETGFISNPREEANLRNSAYQMQLSQSIFRGIKMYFTEYPPHGTRFEAMLTQRRSIASAAPNSGKATA